MLREVWALENTVYRKGPMALKIIGKHCWVKHYMSESSTRKVQLTLIGKQIPLGNLSKRIHRNTLGD